MRCCRCCHNIEKKHKPPSFLGVCGKHMKYKNRKKNHTNTAAPTPMCLFSMFQCFQVDFFFFFGYLYIWRMIDPYRIFCNMFFLFHLPGLYCTLLRNHCIWAAGFASATIQVSVKSWFSRTSTFEFGSYPWIWIDAGGAENKNIDTYKILC